MHACKDDAHMRWPGGDPSSDIWAQHAPGLKRKPIGLPSGWLASAALQTVQHDRLSANGYDVDPKIAHFPAQRRSSSAEGHRGWGIVSMTLDVSKPILMLASRGKLRLERGVEGVCANGEGAGRKMGQQ